jgi:predicted permease
MPESTTGAAPPERSKPDWTTHIRERLPSSLRLSPAREREIVDELAQHLDDRWTELVSGGTAPSEAEALALTEFRDRDSLGRWLSPLGQAQTPASLTPGVSTGRWLEDLWRDVRYSVRGLRRSPGFTALASLTLALAFGANTAIFSVIDAVLLSTLPVDRPHELVFLKTMGSGGTSGAPPYPWFERARADTSTFAGMAVFASDEQRVEIDGRAEQVFGQSVSGSFFDVLGLEPVIGRLFTPDDEQMARPVAVISYGYWQRRFGGRADVLGRTITLDARPHTIVGVTPPDFSGLQPGRQVEMTTPIAQDSPLLRDGLAWWSEAVARLRPGVTAAQATASADSAFQAHMQSVAVDAQLRYTRFQRVEAVPAARGLDRLRNRYSASLQGLMALAIAVLIVGCGNLGTLLLVRGEARTREIAIRQAAGANTGQLLRQLLTETLVLFLLGAAAGLVVARVAVAALVGFFAIGRNAVVLEAQIDWRAGAFAASVALIAAVVTGMWPAVRAVHVDLQQAMRSGDPRLGGAPRARAASRLLIGSQVALCLPLLACALLLALTIKNLRDVDMGFTAERVLTQSLVTIMTGTAAPAQRAQFWTRVLEKMQALPGARVASLSTLTPMSGRDTGTLLGGPMKERQVADRMVHVNHVSEDYLAVFGIRLLQGRAFSAADRTAHVALVNQTTAADVFPERSAVGEMLELGEGKRYQIVGVVKDAKHQSLRETPLRMVYLPLWQPLDPAGRVTLSVATQQPPMSLAEEIDRQVREIEPSALVTDVFDVETQIEATLVGERLLAALGTVFALLALTLSAIGVYGVVSYTVAERRGEMALRMAIGALPSRVRLDTWREVQRPIAAGLACGLLAAWVASSMLRALLFGVTPLDVGAYILATVVLLVVAGGAALLPMLRLGSINLADVMHQ